MTRAIFAAFIATFMLACAGYPIAPVIAGEVHVGHDRYAKTGHARLRMCLRMEALAGGRRYRASGATLAKAEQLCSRELHDVASALATHDLVQITIPSGYSVPFLR